MTLTDTTAVGVPELEIIQKVHFQCNIFIFSRLGLDNGYKNREI